MGKLTTHVLDLVSGRPADGLGISLFRRSAGRADLVLQMRTNSDGRTDAPLLAGDDFLAGEYELVFSVGEYFASRQVAQASPPFLGDVPIRFSISDAAASYHVPLLCSPWAYQTYRGS